MKNITQRILVGFLILSIPGFIYADIIYLKDGTVHEYAVIDEASAREVKFTTRKREIKTVTSDQLLRLRYGQDEVETVSIFTKDGFLIDGFLIEQDAKTVLVRRNKEKNQEELIEKSKIQQMSKDKIVVLYPEMNIRGGIFYPLNSGGAELGLGYAAMLGFYINPPFVPFSKLGIEIGYMYSESDTNEGLFTHWVPFLVNFQYLINISSGNQDKFYLTPRLGGGGSYFIYNDGEGGEIQTVLPAITAGVGVYYTVVPRKFFINLFTDYLLFIDGDVLLHSLMGTLSVQLRF